MAAGDLLFYPNDGTLAGALICWWTAGPFIHVEVDMGDGTAIGSREDGVHRRPRAETAFRWPAGSYCLPKDLAVGLEFLTSTIGFPYSYRDIADAGPLRLFGVILAGDKGFDCSHLAADFLIACGLGSYLGKLECTPERVAPNDLARAVHLIH